MSLDLQFLKDLGISKENAAACTGTDDCDVVILLLPLNLDHPGTRDLRRSWSAGCRRRPATPSPEPVARLHQDDRERVVHHPLLQALDGDELDDDPERSPVLAADPLRRRLCTVRAFDCAGGGATSTSSCCG